jgi:hypothetical protein
MEFILRLPFTHPDLHEHPGRSTGAPADGVEVLRQGPLPVDVRRTGAA